MRYVTFIIPLCAFLVGCETGKPVQSAPKAQPRMDMMSIARGLSNGSVDVFDPSAPTLTMPAPPNQPLQTLDGRAQPSMTIQTNDPSVTIYALEEALPQSAAAPLPMDIEPLPPLSGPDLQPPQSASEDYPSPFPLPRRAK